LHCTAPLSPSAWTRLDSNTDTLGEKTSVSSFVVSSRTSGGAPAAPAAATADETTGGVRLKLAETATAWVGHATGQRARDRAPSACGRLDLCGALSQARVDPQSGAVRELRLALSFPDLEEGRPPDLVKAVQLQQLQGRPATSSADGPTCDSHGVCYPGIVARNAMHRSRRRSSCSSTASRTIDSLHLNGFELRRGGDTMGDSGEIPHGVSTHESPGTRLRPVGWERAESNWDDSSFPEWALTCAPLVTGQGGEAGSTRAFEVCYLEHFGWAGAGGYPEQKGASIATDVEVVRKALAALQGVPSVFFWFDEDGACMRVSGHRGDEQARPGGEMGTRGEEKSGLPPRVPGLSPAALLSVLKEFARAGTWYRRVEEFAACLVDRSSAAGQVAHAFGVELRRQLAALQSALLGVTAKLAGAEWSGSESLRSRSRDTSSAKGCCSLAAALLRTARLRRAAGALAEICGLFEDDLGSFASVRAVFEAFPRGASLLTYLYNAAEARTASKPGAGSEGSSEVVGGVVMGEKDSALALLSTAAAPYLFMLARWLWSGEMRAEDDPHEEFPLRHREVPAGATCPASTGSSKEATAPWMENGGGSFMTSAFSENETAGVPCFLEGGVLAAAAQAGKLLRMLKVTPGAAAGGGGAVSRARNSSARCGRGDAEGNGKRATSIAAANATAAAAAAAAAEDLSAAATSDGRGVLSFLNPPTSEAEAFAAAAIKERYRVLGEEADARAARARWKRRRSARMVTARAALSVLYAEERHLWQIIAAEAAASAAVGSDGAAGNEAAAVHAAVDEALGGVETSAMAIVSDGPDGRGGEGEAEHGSEEGLAGEQVSIDDARGRGNVR
ncbi:unnamed protein product, partial [Hapterophycus canaliculatus]